MTKPHSDGWPGLLGHPPDEVEVTVTVRPRTGGSSIRRRVAEMAARPRHGMVIGLAVLAAAIAAVGMVSLSGGLGGTSADLRGPQATYPTAARCLRATVALGRASRQRAFAVAVWCERYAGRSNAVSYRFVGAALPALAVPSH